MSEITLVHLLYILINRNLNCLAKIPIYKIYDQSRWVERVLYLLWFNIKFIDDFHTKILSIKFLIYNIIIKIDILVLYKECHTNHPNTNPVTNKFHRPLPLWSSKPLPNTLVETVPNANRVQWCYIKNAAAKLAVLPSFASVLYALTALGI